LKNNSKSNLGDKIKAVLLLYLRTQFILTLISILFVWGIMMVVPNMHPVYEILIVIFSYIILSQVMDYLITPYLIGQKVKVSPAFLILAFILGVGSMGLVGAFLSVPIALVLKTIWEHYKQ
jgi:predicted PurR-regulated permease PerM